MNVTASKYVCQAIFQAQVETDNFSVGETDRHYLTQVMKVNITSNKIYWHHTPPIGCT